MKKTLLAIAAVTFSFAVSAQDLMSKKGEAYLPEAGDYAIGFDAIPLLNVFKFNNDDKVSANYAGLNGDANQVGIMIKKFDTAKSAFRHGIRVSWMNSYVKQDVPEFSSGIADSTNFVEDRTKTSSFDALLSYGKEMRKGNTRVQGYYGAEGMLSIGGTRTTYEYGNDFGDLPEGTYNERVRSGVRFGIGARAFFGVEYFIAPKISLNAEYGLSAMLNVSGRGDVDRTVVSSNGDENSETAEGTLRTSSFNLGTDVTSGAIRVLFHF